MFLEAFHRVLKIVYLHHKQNRRVDFLLTTLLKVSRDKAFERLRKLETGKSSHRICEINKRHKSAVEIHKQGPSTVIVLTDKKKWTVESQSQQGTKYVVQKQCDSCDCQLLCKECKVCTHMYSCTCLDSILHSTVCKHIHLVIMSTTVGYASTINGSLN